MFATSGEDHGVVSKPLSNRFEHTLSASPKPGAIVRHLEYGGHHDNAVRIPAGGALSGILSWRGPVESESIRLTE